MKSINKEVTVKREIVTQGKPLFFNLSKSEWNIFIVDLENGAKNFFIELQNKKEIRPP